jgi:hypothetical protein
VAIPVFNTGNFTTPRAGSKSAKLLAAHMRINPVNFMIDPFGAKSKQHLGDLKIG